MPVKETLQSERDLLTQLSGLTGLGWTASILGYLTTLIGYGNAIVVRVAEPQSLLYLGIGLFLATLGLDRLRTDRERENQ